MRRRNPEPKEIVAKYPSRCPETGKQINKGDKCVWFPAAKAVYHMDSEAAERFRSMKFAEAYGMADANW